MKVAEMYSTMKNFERLTPIIYMQQ